MADFRRVGPRHQITFLRLAPAQAGGVALRGPALELLGCAAFDVVGLANEAQREIGRQQRDEDRQRQRQRAKILLALGQL